ncbi:type VII secretion target [Actinoplanes sp. HUAS TT8]|uniref:type VII secretion target n=1 Tax=Actinoplanes sp. HUAS TT8 TaxID=3447453 RepID=UPI003F520D12
MNPDLDVDTQQLRDAAAALDRTASRVWDAAAAAPSPVAGPPWATTGASATAALAAQQQLRGLHSDLSDLAAQIRTTISAYVETDSRAAARLRAAR